MPTRDYDPRRYGPTIDVGAVAASGGLQSASVASRRPLLRGTAGVLVGRGRASSRGDVPTHEVPSSSDDAATPRKGRFRRRVVATPATSSAPSEGPKATSTQKKVHQYHAELTPSWMNTYNTISTATATSFFGSTTASDAGAGFSPPESQGRGRTRTRSLSWHCRQEVARRPVSDSTADSSLLGSGTLDRSSSSSSSSSRSSSYIARHRSSSCGSSALAAGGASRRRSNSHAAGARRERKAGPQGWEWRRGGSARRGGEGAARGESIDAEELYRRKNNMARWNVTYGRWAESYDRSMARRASLERRERLEAEREGDLRRRRAEEEFQKWVRNHAPRPVSSSGSGVGAAAAPAATAVAYGAGYALGARSTYQERASSASPLRRQWVKLETCTGGEGEGRAASSSSGGGGGGSNYRCLGEENWLEREKQRQRRREREREREREKHAKRAKEREREEAEKRDKVDRAFRAWLDRKKKEAQAEREAQRRREEALAKLRKLEASKRWKKRPVVCAYTYGAKIGAREWADAGDDGGGGAAEEGRGQGVEREEVWVEREKEGKETVDGRNVEEGWEQSVVEGEEEAAREERTGRQQKAPDERGQGADGGGTGAEDGDEKTEEVEEEEQEGGVGEEKGNASKSEGEGVGREAEGDGGAVGPRDG